ncbi:MAG TPA: hypothetical protein VG735_13505 [Caulobacterales bacterium]|nr:hypothetical protein [Caulobacterales bacterium]
MRLVLALLCASLSCGCAEVSSIYHNRELTHDRAIVVDAKQRAIIAGPKTIVWEYDETGKKAKRATIQVGPCAEPPPDVFSVLAASAQGNVSYKDIAALSGSYSQSESGASLLTRTTVIQTLRDGFYRLCEAHMRGGMDDVAYTVGLKKFQTELVGLLAIEQLTGAVQSASASIAAASQAQLGSVSALAQQRQAWSLELEQTKQAQKQAEIAAKATATALEKANTDLDKDKENEDLKTAASNAKSEDDKAQKAKSALDAKVASLTASITAIDDSLKGAAPGGSSASASGIVVVTDNAGKDVSEVKDAVVEIVKLINSDDYGPTTCLEAMRRTKSWSAQIGGSAATNAGANTTVYEGPPSSAKCGEIIGGYVTYLQGADARAKAMLQIRLQLASALAAGKITADQYKAFSLALDGGVFAEAVGSTVNAFNAPTKR